MNYIKNRRTCNSGLYSSFSAFGDKGHMTQQPIRGEPFDILLFSSTNSRGTGKISAFIWKARWIHLVIDIRLRYTIAFSHIGLRMDNH